MSEYWFQNISFPSSQKIGTSFYKNFAFFLLLLQRDLFSTFFTRNRPKLDFWWSLIPFPHTLTKACLRRDHNSKPFNSNRENLEIFSSRTNPPSHQTLLQWSSLELIKTRYTASNPCKSRIFWLCSGLSLLTWRFEFRKAEHPLVPLHIKVTFSSMENTALKTSVLLNQRQNAVAFLFSLLFQQMLWEFTNIAKYFRTFPTKILFRCSNPAPESLGPDFQVCPEIKWPHVPLKMPGHGGSWAGDKDADVNRTSLLLLYILEPYLTVWILKYGSLQYHINKVLWFFRK